MNKSEIFLEYKRLLFSVAYDMLGLISDAEDVVQETYLKWMTVGAVTHPKAYLVKIVTNLSINQLGSARKRREEYFGTWLPEPLVTAEFSENTFELYSSLSVGMMVLLEKLSPQERAVFLLKEVFSYDYDEISPVMDKSEENCRQILKRAKDHLGDQRGRFQLDLWVHERLVGEFLKTCADGNLQALIRLLKEDITVYTDNGGKELVLKGERVSALPKPISGNHEAAVFLISVIEKVRKLSDDLRRSFSTVGGVPCVVTYSNGKPINLSVVETDGERILNIYSYGNPDKIAKVLAFSGLS